jgi:leucyl aminopeptidase (aminopeptidase T)
MTQYLDFEKTKIGIKLMDMMAVKKGQVIGITTDTGIDQDIVNSISGAAHAIGAKPLVLMFPQPLGHEGIADLTMPCEALIGALTNVDHWIEANSKFIHYSNTFDQVLLKHPDINHVLLAYLTPEQLDSVINKVNYEKLNEFCAVLKDMMSKSKKMRITNPKGTDIEFAFNHDHILAIVDGDLSGPSICNIPSLVNAFPEYRSVNGRVVFDAVYVTLGVLKAPMTFDIVDSKIVNIEGDSEEVAKMKNWLESYGEENIYKIAHINFGTLPSLTELTGDVILDERLWGIMNFGFGSAPAGMAGPGQQCQGHWDSICTNASVWLDDELVLENKEFVHPLLEKLGQEAMEN